VHTLLQFYAAITVISQWLPLKIFWPPEWTVGHLACNMAALATFLISVDGVHFLVEDPTHPVLSRDPKMFLQKFNKAGLDYEVALDLQADHIVYIGSPFPVSTHDITVFWEGEICP